MAGGMDVGEAIRAYMKLPYMELDHYSILAGVL